MLSSLELVTWFKPDMKNFAEKIFRFPSLYEFKIRTLNKINKTEKFSVEHLTTGKSVLDIGCGSEQYYYDPRRTRRWTAIDTSHEMVNKSKSRYPHGTCLVASGDDLPFPSKSFDVVAIFFVLHHMPPEIWEKVLREAKRVARERILILDHMQHDFLPFRIVQKIWWGIFDGGKVYRKKKEWSHILKPYAIQEYKRMGMMFGNICYFNVEVKGE